MHRQRSLICGFRRFQRMKGWRFPRSRRRVPPACTASSEPFPVRGEGYSGRAARVWMGVRGAAVKAESPAKPGRSEAKRRDLPAASTRRSCRSDDAPATITSWGRCGLESIVFTRSATRGGCSRLRGRLRLRCRRPFVGATPVSGLSALMSSRNAGKLPRAAARELRRRRIPPAAVSPRRLRRSRCRSGSSAQPVAVPTTSRWLLVFVRSPLARYDRPDSWSLLSQRQSLCGRNSVPSSP